MTAFVTVDTIFCVVATICETTGITVLTAWTLVVVAATSVVGVAVVDTVVVEVVGVDELVLLDEALDEATTTLDVSATGSALITPVTELAVGST